VLNQGGVSPRKKISTTCIMILSCSYSAPKVTVHQIPKTACKILKILYIQKKWMEIRQIRQQHSRLVACNSMIDKSKFISEYKGGEIGGFPSIFFHIFNAITAT
jgi:hypothetical protein